MPIRERLKERDVWSLVQEFHEEPTEVKKHLRFGQWVYNKYSTEDDKPWPELFYADDRKAIEILLEL